MYLNPSLSPQLDAYNPECLKALLLWLHADAQSVSNQYNRLSTVLDEVKTMDATACYQAISHLDLDAMVRVSILNEFGSAFEQRPGYQWLNRALSRGLAQRYEFSH